MVVRPDRIEGEGFTLRRWNIEDAAWYVAARDEEIFQWTNERRDLTIAEAEQAFRRVNASQDALCFGIVDPVNQELLGNIALKLEEARPETGEIMYWLAPAGRGRGIAAKAVRRLCRWAFQAARLKRITLKTMRGNARSQRVKRLVVCGLQTEYCVDTTVRRAFSLGYEVTLAANAHSTWHGEVLPAAQIIAHHNSVLDGWFGKVANVEEITY